MVEYKYDAWGATLAKTGSMAGTLGVHNPFRYRGYVFDLDTGLYYLKSRYYNPKWGRFINADVLLGKRGALLGHNLFAYCYNNPKMLKDSNGFSAIPSQVELVKQMAPLIAVSDGDNPSTPWAYAGEFAVAIMLTAAFFSDVTGFTRLCNNLFQCWNSIAFANEVTSEELGSIAETYVNFQCKEAAKALEDYLKKKKKKGETITITFIGGPGFIWSDIKSDTISRNGVHVGVAYEGNVYCNVHPYGLPEEMWLADFHGVGIMSVTRTPF